MSSWAVGLRRISIIMSGLLGEEQSVNGVSIYRSVIVILRAEEKMPINRTNVYAGRKREDARKTRGSISCLSQLVLDS